MLWGELDGPKAPSVLPPTRSAAPLSCPRVLQRGRGHDEARPHPSGARCLTRGRSRRVAGPPGIALHRGRQPFARAPLARPRPAWRAVRRPAWRAVRRRMRHGCIQARPAAASLGGRVDQSGGLVVGAPSTVGLVANSLATLRARPPRSTAARMARCAVACGTARSGGASAGCDVLTKSRAPPPAPAPLRTL